MQAGCSWGLIGWFDVRNASGLDDHQSGCRSWRDSHDTIGISERQARDLSGDGS